MRFMVKLRQEQILEMLVTNQSGNSFYTIGTFSTAEHITTYLPTYLPTYTEQNPS